MDFVCSVSFSYLGHNSWGQTCTKLHPSLSSLYHHNPLIDSNIHPVCLQMGESCYRTFICEGGPELGLMMRKAMGIGDFDRDHQGR